MASAKLSIDIVADASQATAAFDQAAGSASNAAEKIDTVGGRAGDSASGLSALTGALELAGFDKAADAAGLLATGLDAVEGSTMLFKVAQESLSLVTIKDTAARIANGIATVTASAATKAWAAVQWLLNAAMSANPIGLIIGLVVGLIAVIILIATKTTWFQDAWKWAWDAIKKAAAAVWDWIGPAAEAAMNVVLAPVKLVQKAFEKVGDAISAVIDWLKKIKVPDAIGKIGDFIGNINPFTVTGGGGAAAPAPGLSSRAMGRATGGGGAATTVQVYVPESSDPVATARYLKALIRRGEAAGVMFGTV